MQEKWNRWSMRKITPQDIEYAIRGGDSSEEPLTELQREIIAIAAGLASEISDPVEFALIQAEVVTPDPPFGCHTILTSSSSSKAALETEQHGAIFIQRELQRFMSAQKEKHKKKKDTDSLKSPEWVVL